MIERMGVTIGFQEFANRDLAEDYLVQQAIREGARAVKLVENRRVYAETNHQDQPECPA
ncbi:hypothetical protein DSOUD_0843 [Desulfuromonas soudanensis]|uniref:Uncharacterized protein n=1 Tax=Desulfuromonas soudanensis TaxID=1603606 RepID=A0A0M4D7U2_9BACT|nr:hypothetical protein [Desulfuromonas soudanensis]ALC15630.1 hypothetical protein DSOUD_0843 [Desulfuromonas soudanensis]